MKKFKFTNISAVDFDLTTEQKNAMLLEGVRAGNEFVLKLPL